MAFSVANASDLESCESQENDNHFICGPGNLHYGVNDDINLEIDGGNVIITCEKSRYRSDEVKITEDYILYVNGKKVKVDDEQKALLKDYYDQTIELHEEAEIVGIEGAKIGIEGARIGTRAASGVLKMLFLDFDEDEFEEKMERKSEELEKMSEELEQRAEKLEEMADNLEDTHHDLSRKIPELRELEWF